MPETRLFRCDPTADPAVIMVLYHDIAIDGEDGTWVEIGPECVVHNKWSLPLLPAPLQKMLLTRQACTAKIADSKSRVGCVGS